jgi:flavorubredoxin
VGTPTVLAGPHPLAANAVFLANALRPKAQFLAIIGSYQWGGKAVDTLAGMVSNIRAELLGSVMSRGLPLESDFRALNELAALIAEKHRELNLT